MFVTVGSSPARSGDSSKPVQESVSRSSVAAVRSVLPGAERFRKSDQEPDHAISEELGNCLCGDHPPGRLLRVQRHPRSREFDDRGDRERNSDGPRKPRADRGRSEIGPERITSGRVLGHGQQIQKDGPYEIKTLVGQNSVSLTGPVIAKDPQLAYGALSFDVKPGENEYNIVLPAGYRGPRRIARPRSGPVIDAKAGRMEIRDSTHKAAVARPRSTRSGRIQASSPQTTEASRSASPPVQTIQGDAPVKGLSSKQLP